MVTRSTTTEFQPAPPKVRIGAQGMFSRLANVAVIQPGVASRGRLNMSTAPVTNGDRVAGIASSKALSVKGMNTRL